MSKNEEKAVLAGGCFWCIEAIFKNIKGVIKVVSGYSGGRLKNPSYEDLHGSNSGHAEAVEIIFDPEIISYRKLLEVFYSVHDPTTPDRQGNDVGPQYRSVIFYADAKQKQTAEDVTSNFAASLWDDPVVTELKRLEKFYPAEDYHQDYYARQPDNPYCQLVINPKLTKFRRHFKSLLS